MQSRQAEKVLVSIFSLGVLALGFGLLTQAPVRTSGTPEIDFLNVGQGDAALITTEHGKHVLIDGGPDKSVLTELGKQMAPTDRSIDTVILSHPHADHVAGLDYVLDRYQVGQVYLTGTPYDSPEYQQFLAEIKEKRIPARKAFKGQSFNVDGVQFDCIYPLVDVSGETFKDQNEGSDVYDVSSSGQHVLMLGDLSAKSQDTMLSSVSLVPNFGIIKVAHHGSKTGTNDAVLAAIKPKFSVISVGAKNSYGHPAPTTLRQLESIGTIIFRTDQQGTVRFQFLAGGLRQI